MSTGGVAPAQKGSDMYDSEGSQRQGLFGNGTGNVTGTGTGALKHHLRSGTTTSSAFSLKYCSLTCGDVFWMR